VDSFEVQWSCGCECDLGGCKRRRAHCRVKARARARPEHGGARPRTENARSVGCALTGLARRAATNADCGLRTLGTWRRIGRCPRDGGAGVKWCDESLV